MCLFRFHFVLWVLLYCIVNENECCPDQPTACQPACLFASYIIMKWRYLLWHLSQPPKNYDSNLRQQRLAYKFQSQTTRFTPYNKNYIFFSPPNPLEDVRKSSEYVPIPQKYQGVSTLEKQQILIFQKFCFYNTKLGLLCKYVYEELSSFLSL